MEKQIMVETTNSLQYFTDTDSVEQILSSVSRLSIENISLLSRDKKKELIHHINTHLTKLETKEYQEFYTKVKGVINQKFKNATWDRNHEAIRKHIIQFLLAYNRLPTITELAQRADLSRVTITKHVRHINLLEYSNSQSVRTNMMFANFVKQVFAKANHGHSFFSGLSPNP